MKILINYATVSGNSAMLAQQLMDKLKVSQADKEFVYKDADECKGEDHNQYELVIFVSSTWDDGNINMIAEEYLNALQNMQGKKFAVIGLGDSSYPHFCGAVPKIEEKLKSLGVQLVGQSFRIDGFIEEPVVVKAAEWANAILGGLQPGQDKQTTPATQQTDAPASAPQQPATPPAPASVSQQPATPPIPVTSIPAPVQPVAPKEEVVAPAVPPVPPQATLPQEASPQLPPITPEG